MNSRVFAIALLAPATHPQSPISLVQDVSLKAAMGRLLRILGALFFLLKGQSTLAAVVAVEVRRHENTSTAGLERALPPQAGDLAIVVHTVELQRRERVFLVLVRDLLRLGVVLRHDDHAVCCLGASKSTDGTHTACWRPMNAHTRTFFFRFLPPPRSRNTRWRVDSFWML